MGEIENIEIDNSNQSNNKSNNNRKKIISIASIKYDEIIEEANDEIYENVTKPFFTAYIILSGISITLIIFGIKSFLSDEYTKTIINVAVLIANKWLKKKTYKNKKRLKIKILKGKKKEIDKFDESMNSKFKEDKQKAIRQIIKLKNEPLYSFRRIIEYLDEVAAKVLNIFSGDYLPIYEDEEPIYDEDNYCSEYKTEDLEDVEKTPYRRKKTIAIKEENKENVYSL